MEIRKLRPSDERSDFCCGEPDLDRFFHKYAGQNQFRHHIGMTYVAVDGEIILGFVTLSAADMELSELQPALRNK